MANTGEGDVVQGGSTITQQLARALYLGNEQSYSRKLTEGCLAVELDRDWSKERILAGYLNRVPFGNRAYGAEAAARTYFSKPAAKLTLAEAALLAGLPQSPSRLDPLANPDGARARRADVLDAMAETGAITAAQAQEVARSRLGLAPSPAYGRQRDPYLASYVAELLTEEYGEDVLRAGGLDVHTTIDARMQRLARQAVLRTLNRRGDPGAAVVAIDPKDGSVRALASVVPGRRTAFNLAVDGKRQPGSTFKTFVLAEAVRRGINPWSTQYLSAPFDGPESQGKPWHVETYDGTYLGRTAVAGATLASDNSVYARLTLDLGPGPRRRAGPQDGDPRRAAAGAVGRARRGRRLAARPGHRVRDARRRRAPGRAARHPQGRPRRRLGRPAVGAARGRARPARTRLPTR